jgi:hypothetical protein
MSLIQPEGPAYGKSDFCIELVRKRLRFRRRKRLNGFRLRAKPVTRVTAG